MTKSILIDPYYSSGEFFSQSQGWRDASFKTAQLAILLKQYSKYFNPALRRVADVGCGTGDTTFAIAEMLVELGYRSSTDGYDIHPDVSKIKEIANVVFFQRDFCIEQLNAPYDLVVLFDVIEHVPDPIAFLKAISDRTRLVALHIPLDDSVLGWLRGLPRKNIKRPGHLIVLDAASSLNLLTFSGLRIQDYFFTPAFRAPSGSVTILQRLLRPVREIVFRISPYILQKTIGGTSLMVIAQTHIELESNGFEAK